MEIELKTIPENELKKKISDETQLGFGSKYSDYMFQVEYSEGRWHSAVIKKLEPLQLHPGAKVLHYAQEIFEGMKAYRTPDGHLNLFRPGSNIERFNRSAQRVLMPPIDPDLFMRGLKQLLALEKEWAPKTRGASIYIRPTMIGVTPFLGVASATEFLFYIILSPSGPYFKEGFNPIKIYVSSDYVRAAPGGVGTAKTGGNYAASLLAGKVARDHGCSQVLWLDATERKYVEEVGAMNMFFVYDGVVYTAPAPWDGTILPGVTRESTIQLAKDFGYTVKEEALAIDTIIEGIGDGKLSEAFGSGTAASIAPVGSLHYKGKDFTINGFENGPLSTKLYQELTDIQWGRKPDPHDWITQAV